jgi:PQQ-like domain
VRETPIIELGGDWDLLEDPQPRPRWSVHRLRAVAAAALVLLCLAALGGAGRPQRPLFSLLGFVDRPSAGARVLGPAELALVGGMLLAPRSNELRAYDPDGGLRWIVRVDPTGRNRYLSFYMWRGNLVLEQGMIVEPAEGTFAGTVVATSVALDPGTGAERWRISGVLEPLGDLVVVHARTNEQRVYQSLPSGLLWTIPPAQASAIVAKSNTVFTLSAEGLLTEYELHTGAVRGSGAVEMPHFDTPGSAEPPGVGGYPQELALEVFQDRIVLHARQYRDDEPLPRSATLSYDRATLRSAGSPMDRFDGALDCGPVLCGVSGERVSILDPSDLSLLWELPSGEYPYWTGTVLTVSGPARLAPQRVVHPRTGAMVVNLDGWEAANDRRTVAERTITWFTRLVPPHHTYVASVDGTGLHVVGSIPFHLTSCDTEGLLLACTIPDGRVGVWRVNLD